MDQLKIKTPVVKAFGCIINPGEDAEKIRAECKERIKADAKKS